MPDVIDIHVILPPRTLLTDIAGPLDILRLANEFQAARRFRIHCHGVGETQTSSVGLILAGLEPLPDRLADGAVVIVSGNASGPDDNAAVETERDRIVEWLSATIVPGIRLLTICSGALLAARAGLLDDHACTTHFSLIDRLARIAPRARPRDNCLFVEDGERWTSAGISAGTDLMLHFVERICGPDVAAAIAREMLIYIRRTGAEPQASPWLAGRNHLHPAIHRVQDAIAADPARPWTVEALAAIAATSPRHLSRLFGDNAGMAIPAYVNMLRIERARALIETSRLDMERIAEKSGFSSSRQLRRAWSRFNDGPPARLRGRAAKAE